MKDICYALNWQSKKCITHVKNIVKKRITGIVVTR